MNILNSANNTISCLIKHTKELFNYTNRIKNLTIYNDEYFLSKKMNNGNYLLYYKDDYYIENYKTIETKNIVGYYDLKGSFKAKNPFFNNFKKIKDLKYAITTIDINVYDVDEFDNFVRMVFYNFRTYNNTVLKIVFSEDIEEKINNFNINDGHDIEIIKKYYYKVIDLDFINKAYGIIEQKHGINDLTLLISCVTDLMDKECDEPDTRIEELSNFIYYSGI